MKNLTISIVSLALIALMVGHAAADAVPMLKADLDGDGDLETVAQASGPSSADLLFWIAGYDKDGDPALIQTRGVPTRLCHLDTDTMPEAVIQDALMASPWAAYALPNPGPTDSLTYPELVFVRGKVVACVARGPSLKDVLIVSDPLFGGTADIDGDGVVDIVWEPLPTSMGGGAAQR